MFARISRKEWWCQIQNKTNVIVVDTRTGDVDTSLPSPVMVTETKNYDLYLQAINLRMRSYAVILESALMSQFPFCTAHFKNCEKSDFAGSDCV